MQTDTDKKNWEEPPGVWEPRGGRPRSAGGAREGFLASADSSRTVAGGWVLEWGGREGETENRQRHQGICVYHLYQGVAVV